MSAGRTRDSQAAKGAGHGGPARGYSWPPFEEGNDAALQHGAFSPAKIKPLAERFATEIRALVPLGSASDDPAVWLLATMFARLELASLWLDEQENALVDGDGTPWPVLRHVPRWERQAASLCEKLGLSLASRSEIGLALAGTAAIARRSDLSALSLEELSQLRELTRKAQSVPPERSGDAA